LKVFFGVLSFCVVLTGAIVSKASLFFIVAQASRIRRLLKFCTKGIPLAGTVFEGAEAIYVTYGRREAVAWLW